MKPQPITLEGITYPSIKAAARARGIKQETVFARLKTGWTIEQTFEIAPKPPRKKRRHKASARRSSGKPLTVNGITYPSIKTACEAYGISPALIYTRLRMSWTAEQAFELEARPRSSSAAKSITVNGVNYRSLQAACNAYRISRSGVTFYLNRGITIERAFELVCIKQRLRQKEERRMHNELERSPDESTKSIS